MHCGGIYLYRHQLEYNTDVERLSFPLLEGLAFSYVRTVPLPSEHLSHHHPIGSPCSHSRTKYQLSYSGHTLTQIITMSSRFFQRESGYMCARPHHTIANGTTVHPQKRMETGSKSWTLMAPAGGTGADVLEIRLVGTGTPCGHVAGILKHFERKRRGGSDVQGAGHAGPRRKPL